MKFATLFFLTAFLGFVQCSAAQVTSQSTSGNCSANLSNVKGPVTLQFSGNACQGIDQESVKQINAFLARYPEERDRLLDLLKVNEADLKKKVQEIATLTVKYNTVNKQLASLGGSEHIAKMVQMNAISEKDRAALDITIRELEAVLAKTKFQTSPENLVLLGWYCVRIAQYDKAEAFFLAATAQNPSQGEAYLGLAYVWQMQGNQFLQRGDPDKAQKALDKSAGYVKIAQQYDQLDASALTQLGYTEKDLAQVYADKGLREKASAADESAARHFRMVLGANPQDAGAHNGLGNIYYDQGNLVDAIKEYQIATTAQAKYTFAWYDLVLALRKKYGSEGQTVDQDRETLASLIKATATLLQLSQDENAQRLPQPAFQAILDIAHWASAEAAKYKQPAQQN